MEISEAIAALRARPWIVLAFGVMGLLAGFVSQAGGGDAYESVAQLNVLPPTSSGTLGQISASQLDRYQVAQLTVLNSADTAAVVAGKVGGGISAAAARAAITVEPIPNSDVVTLTARAGSAKQATAIAQAYLDTYIKQTEAALRDQLQPEIDRLDKLIADLKSQLADNDNQIAAAMRPYTSSIGPNSVVPDVASVAPSLATRKQVLLAENDRLTTARAAADYSNAVRNNSVAIQDATKPTEPTDNGSKLPIILGGFAGVMLGALVTLLVYAVADASLSEETATAALGLPVLAKVPHDRNQVRRPTLNLAPLSAEMSTAVDQVCVPALVQTDGPVRIAVTSARRGAGCTSLALAMASRYADAGHSVVVVDMDAKDQFLTMAYASEDDQLVSHIIDDLITGSRSKRSMAPTGNGHVEVLGFGEHLPPSAVLRPKMLNSVIEWSEADCDVVIFDLGPALESTLVRQVAAVSDSVVLAVALFDQTSAQLRAARRALEPVADRLLPVVTNPSKHPADVTGGLIGEAIEAMLSPKPGPTTPTVFESKNRAARGTKARKSAAVSVIEGDDSSDA